MIWTNRWQQRWRRRLGLVITNSVNQLLPILFGPIVSLLVIRRSSATIWGSFVGILLLVQLASHVMGWGNREYLLRAFSRKPHAVGVLWQTSLFTRMPLLALFALLVLLWFEPSQAGWILLWAIGLMLHQSFQVLIVFRRDFIFSAAVELAGLILLALAVWRQGQALDPDRLIELFAGVWLLKAMALALRFRPETRGILGRFDIAHFAVALPFFLLSLSGMLNSRMDLYVVAYRLPDPQVAHYQVFTSFLVYVQALAGFIVVPFVRSLYRLPHRAIARVSLLLLVLGLLIVPVGMVLLSWLIPWLYAFTLPWHFYVLGGLISLPIYYTLPLIHLLYKENLQNLVLLNNVAASILSLLLLWIMLPGLGLLGALVASVLVRWGSLLFYTWQSRGVRARRMAVIGDSEQAQ